MAQACRRRGADYACGAESRRAMAAILGRGVVSCAVLGTDAYGRRLVRCHNEAGADIGAELVRQGWALAFTRYSMAYVGQERRRAPPVAACGKAASTRPGTGARAIVPERLSRNTFDMSQ
jgi:endonuclease YncB( thermonuclease family)